MSQRTPRLRTSTRGRLTFAVLASAIALLGSQACGRSGLDDFAGGVGGTGGMTSLGTRMTTTMSTATNTGGHGGEGAGKPCTIANDCNDNDPCTTDECKDGHCHHRSRDDDGDGHAPIGCTNPDGTPGDDCNDQNANVFPGHPEVCGDGSDNDCNGVADCQDPACAGKADCACVPKKEDCTNGKDDDCDGLVDCFDPDCQGTPACGCAANEQGKCDDGFDNDGDGLVDCADPDCFGATICQCKMQQEQCNDGIDNDCNGLIDCADPACAFAPNCRCTPPGEPENCHDGKDNDCDGLVDCADPDCFTSPDCAHCTTEICDDGIDNNCDGKIDCADPSCAHDPHCQAVAEICNNGIDDDHDGLIDCADPDCATNPICVLHHQNCLTPQLIGGSGTYTGNTTGNIGETRGSCGGDAGEADYYFVLGQPTKVHIDTNGSNFDTVLYLRSGECNHGKELGCDDDSGINHASVLDFVILYPGTYYLFVDGYTVDVNQGPDQGPYTLHVQFTANPPEICDDGIDNDGDHLVDCADPDCVNAPNCFKCNGGKDPEPEMGEEKCSDGIDNDCDGLIDCADPDCHASEYYPTDCCNGQDLNGNGIVDDFNCRCPDDSVCPAGQFCYNHTVFACGIPCTGFIGDVCPFIAPGSFCNTTTQQCEFP